MQKLISNFLKNLGNTTDEKPITDHEIHLATALLLVEIGRADFHWQPEETKTTIDSIARLCELSADEARSLFDEAMQQGEQHISLHPVVETLNQHCSKEQKRKILLDCWRVAYADNSLDRYEEHHIRKITDWLYLHHSDFIQAKLKAEAESRKRNVE